MSKFSKILAILMSVCLLFGATTAFLATATEGETQDPLNVTNHGANHQVAETVLTKAGLGATTYYYYPGAAGIPSYDATREITEVSYVTLDFDINIVGVTTERLVIKPRILTYDTADAKGAYRSGGGFYFYSNNGAPYLGTTTDKAMDLSSEEDVYDHITVVFKCIDNATVGSKTLDQKVYVNGQYCGVNFANVPHKADNKLSNYSMFYGFSLNTLSDTDVVKFKNIAVNYYTSNDADLANYVVKTPTARLYDIDGVVFNENYAIPGVDYVSVDGKKTCIPEFIPKVLATVENGSVVEATVDVLDFDVPDEVDNFTLIYDSENTEFTLSEEDKSRLVKLENSDGSYTVRSLSESDKMQLKNIVKYGDKELVVKSGAFVFLMQPEVDASFTVFDLESLTLYEVENITGWKIDVDGKVPDSINLYGEENLRALSLLEAELIKEEFDGILTTYATAENGSVKETKGYAYIAGYLNDGVFTPIEDSDGGYENYKDIATLEAEKATWDSDVVCYEIVDGKATLHEGSAAQGASAIWNSSSNQLTGTTDTAVSAGVTNIVKNSFKDNGTVDGYGILIIR